MIDDYYKLMLYAKLYSSLTSDKERIIKNLANSINYSIITEGFYEKLFSIDEVKPYLTGKVDKLKETHTAWVHSAFTDTYDIEYTKKIYKIGEVHVNLNIPIEFMSGGINIISNLIYEDLDKVQLITLENVQAINSAMTFNLFIMELSYTNFFYKKIKNFQNLTGISESLFNRLSNIQ